MINTKLFNRICLVAIALSIGMTASAQYKLRDINGMGARIEQSLRKHFTMKNGQLAPIPISRSVAQKPTATNSRIVGMYGMEFDGTQYQGVDDSLRFYWSGTRGGDFDYAWFLNYMYLGMANPLKHELELVMPMYRSMNFDSLNSYSWDGGTTSFSAPNSRSSTTLTSSGLLNTITALNFTGGVWENDNRNTLTWNNDNNLTAFQYDTWDGVTWEADYRSTLSYNTAKDITEVLNEDWDLGSSAWENTGKTIYGYTGSDLTMITSQNWMTAGSTWENDYRQNLGYNSGRWVSSTYQDWNTLTTAWESSDRSTFTYDPDGKITQQLVEDWNILTSAWENSERWTYAYDANGDISSITVQVWTAGAWEPDERYTYTYATSGMPVSSLVVQDWDGGSSSWENQNRVNIKYNQHDRITEMEFQTWDIGGFWDVAVNDEKYYFIYETFDDGTTNKVDEFAKTTGLRYYPNPASAQITIETEHSTIGQVRLTDVTGRTVEQLTPAQHTQLVHLPTTQLAPGIYFLQVMHDGKAETVPVQIRR